VGKPEYKSFLYQAASWEKARRVVAKVEHHQGELFPRVGFIVTSLSLPSRAVVRFYNKHGTAGAMDQGRQAGNALDPAVVSSVPGQRSALKVGACWPTTWGTCGGGWCCRRGS